MTRWTWRYRLINEDTAREITFNRRVARNYVLRYLATQHQQLIAEIWAR